jgi:hypothetical protein
MRSRAAVRISLLLLLLCTTLCAQTASVASEQFHQHSSQHCCGLCHAGPLPFLTPSTSSAPAPAFAPAWLEVQDRSGAPREALLASGSSRAPPL